MTLRTRDQCLALSVLFLLVHAAVAAQFGPNGPATAQNYASSRKLQGANFLPFKAGITANIAGVSVPLTLPLFGGIGQAAAESPKKFYRVNCDNPRPTFVMWPGMAGSQLDGTQTGGVASCPRITTPRQIYADVSWLGNLPCFAHMLSANYDHSTGRYSNSSGSQVWAYEGGYPDGSLAFLSSTYWGNFIAHMESAYGYQRGVDLIMAPYDWRWDYDAHNQIGTFDEIAARIAAAVNQNCGQKAVIMAHSLGPQLLLRMLREPRFQNWKQQNVKSIILAGGTLSGAAAATWQSKLSGIMDPFPLMTIQFSSLLNMLPITPYDAAMYQMSMGLPAFGVLLPGPEGLGRNHVLVKTPSRDYTVAQQKELLKDMGDEQSLTLIDKVAAQNQANLAGPIPGIETYCIYGANVATPLTLEYGEPVAKQQVMRRPRNIIKGPGDGTVDIATLRLCNKLAPAANIIEITDPSVDHAAVVQSQAAFEAMAPIFAKVGVIKGKPVQAAQRVDQPVSNRAAAQGAVVEERGKQG